MKNVIPVKHNDTLFVLYKNNDKINNLFQIRVHYDNCIEIYREVNIFDTEFKVIIDYDKNKYYFGKDSKIRNKSKLDKDVKMLCDLLLRNPYEVEKCFSIVYGNIISLSDFNQL